MDAAVCTNIYIDDRSTQAFSNGTSPRGDAGSKTACTGPSVANASATPAADLTAGEIQRHSAFTAPPKGPVGRKRFMGDMLNAGDAAHIDDVYTRGESETYAPTPGPK
jgi:hypothetical protein